MLVALGIALSLVVPAAPSEKPCETPQAAASTWLGNLQPGEEDRAMAIRCTEKPGGWDDARLETAVVQLKRVLDARGIYVRVDELPTDNDYRDPVTGNHRVKVSSQLDQIVLVRREGRWVLSDDTLRGAKSLYRETFPVDLDRVVQSLPAWMTVKVFGLAGWQALFFLILVTLGYALRWLVSEVITRQLRRLMKRLGVLGIEELLEHAASPLGLLVMAGLIYIGIPALNLPVRLATVLFVAVRTMAAVSVVMLAYRAADIASNVFASRAEKTDTKLDDQLIPVLRKTAKVAIVLVGIIFVLQNLDVDVTSLLTGVGLGGLALALAAKDMAMNFFGSITIFTDHPFQIGDWVNTAGVEGVVEEVGMRSTRIRTFYNSVVTVPNGKFIDATVDNYGRREFRRCSIKLGVTYDTTPEQIEAFCNGIRGLIKAHPATRKDYYEVHFAGYGDFALEIMLYFFFAVPSWTDELRARHELFLDFLRLAKSLDIGFAFPTQSIHIEAMAKPGEGLAAKTLGKAELEQRAQAFGPDGSEVIPAGLRAKPGFYADSAVPTADRDA